MSYHPHRAFILAAGMGTRLRPYTDDCPKPLVKIGSRTIIDQALDKLIVANVNLTTINLHYMGEALETHLKTRTEPRLIFSREETLLDTGGGVKNALNSMKDEPFYLLNGDTIWTDGPRTALDRLAGFWDETKMDLLLLLQPIEKMTLTHGVGDYNLLPDGKAIRSHNQTGSHMFASIRIVNPKLFENTPDEPFSFLSLMDRAEKNGRLYGVSHDGEWHHISTAEELERIRVFYGDQKRSA